MRRNDGKEPKVLCDMKIASDWTICPNDPRETRWQIDVKGFDKVRFDNTTIPVPPGAKRMALYIQPIYHGQPRQPHVIEWVKKPDQFEEPDTRLIDAIMELKP